MSDATPTADWRDDPGWRPVEYDPGWCVAENVPARPTPEAELAQPPVWASLYIDRRIVVTWWRPTCHATMVASQ